MLAPVEQCSRHHSDKGHTIMGFFSMMTGDTQESIPNIHSNRKTFKVYMLAPDGRKWPEENYEGYGIFDGKDYYELLAELNGHATRDEGINLDHILEIKSLVRPRLVRSISVEYEDVGDSKPCRYQGIFYDK